jgi:hypothetical protein
LKFKPYNLLCINQLARISFKLPNYLVSYCSSTVATTVTLGVSQTWSDTSRVLGDRTIGRPGDAVCDPHRIHGGDEKHRFPILASKMVVIVCQWFDLKTTATISWSGPQNKG